MSDRVNEELLSAYLDNEVTAEERARVEQALADSPETRRSLESLKQVQTRVQAIPQLSLPADFHERVLREAERRAAEQQVVAPSVHRTAPGLRYAALVVTVAAALLVAVLVVRRDRENPQPGGTDVVVEQDRPRDDLPGDDVLVAAAARQRAQFVVVMDLAITKRGQNEDLFAKVLNNAGIAFDAGNEGVVLKKDLRGQLLESRFVAGVNQGHVKDRFDVIDMVYVHATGQQFDEVFKLMVESPEAHASMDLAFKPESTQVLHSIGDHSWSLAQAQPVAPRSFAYRLNVGIVLHSSRSGFFAKFPTPGIDVRLLENDGGSGSTSGLDILIPQDNRGNQPGDVNAGNAGGGNAVPGPAGAVEDPISEILVILRNLDAGFPAR